MDMNYFNHIVRDIKFIALSASFLFLVSCDKTQQQISDKAAPVIVTHATPASRSVRHWAGTVRAGQSTSLAFEISGRLVNMTREIGDVVKKGEVIAEIDAEPFELERLRAAAEVTAAQPALDEATRRMEIETRLLDSESTSRTKLEAAVTAHAAALARLEAARAALSLAERAVRTCKLVAPADGRIAGRHASVGKIIAAGESVFDFDPNGGLEFVTLIPASYLQPWQAGAKVKIRHSLGNSQTAESIGEVKSIGPRAAAGGIHAVVVTLEGNSTAKVGEAGSARSEAPEIDSGLQVPATAILPQGGDKMAVMVVSYESKLELREVALREIEGDQAKIESGLAPGERVVALGANFLRAGQSVRVQTRPSETSNPSH